MKKVVSLLLVCLMAFSLAACDSKEVVNETPVEEVVPEVKVENDIVLKGEFLSEYAELDANDINKFIGTAIVNVRPEEFRKNDIPVVSKDSPYSDLIFTLFHVKEEYFDKYALSTSQSNTRAYTVAVIKANYGYEEDILNGFGERLTDLYNNSEACYGL